LAGTRVYILAKELGVKSGAIVEKCQAEGLDVKNHMSAISAGLAATIQEWFSEGEHATTVETTEKVDLRKVRVKKKKKRKSAKKKAASTKEPSEPAGQEKPANAQVAGEPAKQAAPAELEPAAKAEPAEPAPAQEPVKEEKPPEPEPIVPAGPMLEKPKPAKLAGPKVIRVESPEPAERPRPKPRPKAPRPRRDTVLTEALMYTQPDTAPPVPARPGKGKKSGKTRGRRRETPQEEPAGRSRPERHGQQRLRDKDMQERRARLEAAGAQRLRLRPSRKIETKRPGSSSVRVRPEKVTISEPITVKDLSAALAAKNSEIISKLMRQGVMATANQVIKAEEAELVALELGVELVVERKLSLKEKIKADFEARQPGNLQKRCPVVTLLGHVDHGKTSLLDYIRSSKVAEGEAGGITQHIGAYQVTWDGKAVTFLDTPGHEAFTSMRARGATMTDIIVLVVAADDGVMPQTVEAINHAKAANVPIIVALNKIDLPGCDLNRVYGQLAEHDLTPAEWSGETEIVKTSATTGEGINDLLEHLDYTAELLELKADPDVPATGWVVEARMTTHQGPVATVLVREGRLAKGDIVFTGSCYGRLKSLTNSYGKKVKAATSSMPVEITGLNDVPSGSRTGSRLRWITSLAGSKPARLRN